MFKKFMLILILLPTVTMASEWKMYLEDSEMGDIYYSPPSISQDIAGNTLVWTKVVPTSKKQTNGELKVLYAINCQSRQLGEPRYKVYNKKGKLIDERDSDSVLTTMRTPEPDSIGSSLIHKFCD